MLPIRVRLPAAATSTVVEILDPTTMVTLTGRDELKSVATEAGTRPDAALVALVTVTVAG